MAPGPLCALADQLQAGGHRFLITRDLDAARDYLRERYSDARFARYGLVASSKDKWLPEFGVDNTFQTTKQLRVGPWYNADPSNARSCCRLDTVATELSQGLELDCALLGGARICCGMVWLGRLHLGKEPSTAQRSTNCTEECLSRSADQRARRNHRVCTAGRPPGSNLWPIEGGRDENALNVQQRRAVCTLAIPGQKDLRRAQDSSPRVCWVCTR